LYPKTNTPTGSNHLSHVIGIHLSHDFWFSIDWDKDSKVNISAIYISLKCRNELVHQAFDIMNSQCDSLSLCWVGKGGGKGGCRGGG